MNGKKIIILKKNTLGTNITEVFCRTLKKVVDALEQPVSSLILFISTPRDPALEVDACRLL